MDMSIILSGVAAVIVMNFSCRSRCAGSATMRAGVNTAEVNSDVLRRHTRPNRGYRQGLFDAAVA